MLLLTTAVRVFLAIGALYIVAMLVEHFLEESSAKPKAT
jgi:hypothetical protein